MRAAPRPEPVREPDEVRLVDRVQHLDHRPLDDLVLQRGDPERPLPPVRLRDVRPPRRLRPVAPAMQPSRAGPEGSPPGPPVVRATSPHPPPARPSGGALERRPEAVDVDVVQERGEPHILVLPRHLAHAVQPIGTPCPALSPGRVALAAFPLAGPLPSTTSAALPGLFGGFAGTTGLSDFPRSCITAYGLGLPDAARPTSASGRAGDLPVLAHGDSVHARGL